MTKPAFSPDVDVTVVICARPATVFAFFADPANFAAWIGHGSTIEPRKGGTVAVRSEHGPAALGRILDWVPDQRLVFTWGHEPGAGLPPDSSRVTVTLREVAGGTEVRLVHSGLPGEAAAGTNIGWRAHLSSLANRASLAAVAGRLEGTIDAFLRAWTEADAERRTQLIAQSFAERGRYRDLHASLDGREALHAWMGFTQQLFPGCRLARTGPIEQTHHYARFPWAAALPDGNVVATGADYLELDANGQLANVVGFWDPPK
jgi:uncharacterized protein YndB with AHSA1/START domain